MFETRTELKDQLAAANADIERLESELAAAQALNDEAAANAQRIAELEQDLAAARDGLIAEENAHAETKAALAAEQEKTSPEALNALVAAKLTEAGHQPLDLDGVGDSQATQSKTPHLDHFESLTGGAATRYFNKHRAEIREEMRSN